MAVSEEHGSGGATDLSEHLRTWRQFIGFIRWSLGGIFFIMLLLLIFRTHN